MADPTLAEFVLARLAEEEAGAEAASAGPWAACVDHHQRGVTETGVWCEAAGRYIAEFITSGDQAAADAAHIARWDPARVLAEVELKRRIVASYTAALVEYDGDGRAYDYESTVGRERTSVLERAVRDLASAYSGHDDYRAEWAPDAR